MNNRLFSFIPIIGAIFVLFTWLLDKISTDTYFICTSIFISALTIILVTEKNNK